MRNRFFVGGVSDADTRTMQQPPKPVGQSSLLRKGRISEDWGCYVVTKVVGDRQPRLADEKAATIVLDSLLHLRETDQIKLFAFCVMPNHLHLAICLLPAADLVATIASFSKYTGARINRLQQRSGRFWQEGFHDRHCRTRGELIDLCEYIEHNPVRAGLVGAAAELPFSSASLLRKVMLDREWWP